MAMINIPRTNTDPFNRYKMPRLVATVTRAGNACKTILVNVSAVAKSLHRSPIYITNYFGFELSTSIRMDVTSNLYIIKGAHNQEKLQDLLDDFINILVLCRYCGNPETELVRQNFNNILFRSKKKFANQLNDPISIQELITEAERLKIVEKAPFYVAECLFTDQILKEIEVYKTLLYRVCFQFIVYGAFFLSE
ncbi:unnamed protein product [Rotaria sp. Silwood1]|nr:unnamed protein product [Rotaria sp. Silwood1]CAF1656534.1 unnamed protein product [Rotaria sp. Silwood1]